MESAGYATAARDYRDSLRPDVCGDIIIDLTIVEQARAAFLRTFRETGGCADLTAVFADGGVLALLDPTFAPLFGSAGVTVVVAPEAEASFSAPCAPSNSASGSSLLASPAASIWRED